MYDKSLNWRSFWDLTTPPDAAEALKAEYGDRAAGAAIECARAAGDEDRPEDRRYWRRVVAELTPRRLH